MKTALIVYVVAIGIAAIALPLIANILFTIEHEEAHQEVYRIYGLKSTVNYNFLGTSTTHTNENITNEAEKLSLANSQSIVESFGYQLRPVIMLLSILTSLTIIAIATNVRRQP